MMMMRIAKMQRLGRSKIEMNELPVEIWRDILSRVPARSLYQCCRLVCKDWYNLIKDPDFINFHHSRINKYVSDGLIALCHTTEFVDWAQFFNLVDNPNNNTNLTALRLHFDLPSDIQSIKIVGSVNGLMCLALLPRHNIFFICNPVTRDVLQLPKAPGLGPYSQKYNLKYLFPATSGFAFHAATNTYKVVRTWFFRVIGGADILQGGADILQTGIEIYTLGSGVWRWIDVNISSMLCDLQASHVFLHEALHWQIVDLKKSQPYTGVIDIGDENFRTFENPMEEVGLKARNLSTLRQCLCLIDEFSDHNAIWTMKQYGVAQSWTKEHIIRKEIFGSLQTMSFDTLTTMNNGSVLLHGGKHQGYYDFEKQEFKQILIDGFHSSLEEFQIVGHVGSLISPGSIICASDVSQVSSAKRRRPIGFRLTKNTKKLPRPVPCITRPQEFLL
ncbi:F-box protein [Thalictrum thalictroides]|uniref:F-box protein n=1 Tax=Thalictrum thalictroides TaxID=46969 RepID=A0A7J6V131_THATH|nr:F-box protein [Thalictrum thalictroides]